ncbi:hypothetical protein CFRS1_v010917 [Colletotrichum fructicola]|nr:hypothetical protein CFRS1_v010917 [Colletotrichum fructicola]
MISIQKQFYDIDVVFRYSHPRQLSYEPLAADLDRDGHISEPRAITSGEPQITAVSRQNNDPSLIELSTMNLGSMTGEGL